MKLRYTVQDDSVITKKVEKIGDTIADLICALSDLRKSETKIVSLTVEPDFAICEHSGCII